MLSTLIYRSHICDDVPLKEIEEMVALANKKNERCDVTGILLFNGTHFFQLLEGPESAVVAIYNRIYEDRRHHNIVELMRDYAPERRFGNSGMELFDLREHERARVLQAVLDKGTSAYQLTYDDRALRFLRTFVEATEKETYYEIPRPDYWLFAHDDDARGKTVAATHPSADCRFAFQPVVDPFARRIISLEALIRTPEGALAEHYLAGLPADSLYEADLNSKMQAFAMAKRLAIGEQSLTINLLPMSLVMVPDAVERLLRGIVDSGLVPQQIIIEFSEKDVISRPDAFSAAIRQLKAAGISLGIDDFGAGVAGLQLLARFQPDRIKINRSIINDVHRSGPRQAIVHAIIRCCASLEIGLTASGVEKTEEWMWLEAAGISTFQGFLFAAPLLNGIPAVAWPDN
ncbi:diguanylate phosphodiesterase [Erwinia sp. OLTSP20]|uniref:diguanylate phosphodiesterase n=1 Tax=unclassified Erwinia TaxID=2622719 RepID=UPI000C19D54E|nr:MULTISPECIES: diguanylate phosphodiesterase [unclassified Erwinia]PIJ50953.1 diguanylate phosphodiesterase [Erwinia sp. OAMSP11]PIJ75919.1 diguanylate phosphodiesterase [Erwinia sp. OLSSP12]PIJ83635.1 diguanylate phosphodiesterase [Erwinia sp. OLCASP19]PIJ87491.1 diguanylate phosphodiesterase [Erwinia sp. OLMTSP26]PIJ89039.1 diguanylate phosphodiesterase [Erwinia sp. OLMDSP33]